MIRASDYTGVHLYTLLYASASGQLPTLFIRVSEPSLNNPTLVLPLHHVL